jgi:hypothetical protein
MIVILGWTHPYELWLRTFVCDGHGRAIWSIFEALVCRVVQGLANVILPCIIGNRHARLRQALRMACILYVKKNTWVPVPECRCEHGRAGDGFILVDRGNRNNAGILGLSPKQWGT